MNRCRSCKGDLYHYAGCGIGEHGDLVKPSNRRPSPPVAEPKCELSPEARTALEHLVDGYLFRRDDEIGDSGYGLRLSKLGPKAPTNAIRELFDAGFIEGFPNGSGAKISDKGKRAYLKGSDELGDGKIYRPSPPAEPKCDRCGRELIKENDMDVGGDNAPYDRLDVGNCRICPPTTEPAESEGTPPPHEHWWAEPVYPNTKCQCGLMWKDRFAPTAPPAETTEDEKALEDRAKAFIFEGAWDTLHGHMARFAQAEIERQTPAIIDRFVERVLVKSQEFRDGSKYAKTGYRLAMELVAEEMQTVKARQSKGEDVE